MSRIDNKQMTVEEIIEILELEPLPVEGGMFRSTYHSEEKVDGKDMSNSIYYLLKGDAFSHLHKLPHDEIYGGSVGIAGIVFGWQGYKACSWNESGSWGETSDCDA